MLHATPIILGTVSWEGVAAVVLGFGQLVALVGIAWLGAVITPKVNRIDTLEGRLKEATEKAIDQRFNAQSDITEVRMRLVERQVEQINTRAGVLEAKDAELTISMVKEISQLKDRVATKGDLDRLREEIKRHG